jgi:hypothetical protein
MVDFASRFFGSAVARPSGETGVRSSVVARKRLPRGRTFAPRRAPPGVCFLVVRHAALLGGIASSAAHPALAALAVLTTLAACGDDADLDKTAACRLGAQASASTVQDRKIIGVAAPYAADLGLAARDAELEASIAQRRAAAWQIVQRVLQPIPLAEPLLAQQFGGQPAIPAWHTWYARDDFDRVFKKLYRDLGPTGRRARAPISAGPGLAWNAVALDSDPAWPEQRYLDYLAAIDTADELEGVGGASRVGYSPGALGHLVESYAKLHECRLVSPPDPYAPDPVHEGRLVSETEAVSVDTCEWRVLGPFQAAAAAFTVTPSGDGDADLYVRRGEAPTADDFDCRSRGSRSDEACTIDGGGPIYVALFGAAASRVDVQIEYLAADVAAPRCLGTAMPRDAVLVKADWRRQLPGGELERLPSYDSSAPRMAARLAGDGTWDPSGDVDPPPSDIYTVQLPSGARFRLPALHVMTKELDHWVWITLWWSAQPDTDFGADRPAAIAALPGPWRNYKMCVSTGYVERDPDPRGGFPGSLGDALAAVHRGPGGPSWCSNPYLEQGPGNAATNCIGCHQHGGTPLTPSQILATPHHGSTRVRNNFFTDYLWAIQGGNGEDLSALVQAEVDYWDANDP